MTTFWTPREQAQFELGVENAIADAASCDELADLLWLLDAARENEPKTRDEDPTAYAYYQGYIRALSAHWTEQGTTPTSH
jgi:hypothetical protein